MTNQNGPGIIRHARRAVGLVLSGATRDFENTNGGHELVEFTTDLFDNVQDEIADWEMPSCKDTRRRALVAFLTESLDPEVQIGLIDKSVDQGTLRKIYRILLTKFDLLP